MGLFGNSSERDRERIREALHRLDLLESAVQDLRLEKASLYEKAYQVIKRLERRDKLDKSREDRAPEPSELDPYEGYPPAARRILERRNRTHALRAQLRQQQG